MIKILLSITIIGIIILGVWCYFAWLASDYQDGMPDIEDVRGDYE
jgi:hypothetical protein